jgi:hypothetical protein
MSDHQLQSKEISKKAFKNKALRILHCFDKPALTLCGTCASKTRIHLKKTFP